jgi:hypothetical protein
MDASIKTIMLATLLHAAVKLSMANLDGTAHTVTETTASHAALFLGNLFLASIQTLH